MYRSAMYTVSASIIYPIMKLPVARILIVSHTNRVPTFKQNFLVFFISHFFMLVDGSTISYRNKKSIILKYFNSKLVSQQFIDRSPRLEPCLFETNYSILNIYV